MGKFYNPGTAPHPLAPDIDKCRKIYVNTPDPAKIGGLGGAVATQEDDLESIPTDDNDTWHLYPGDTFPIPAGTMSLCGIRAKYTLEDGGDYGPMNPSEDRTCVVCKRIADDVNDADERDKQGWKDVD